MCDCLNSRINSWRNACPPPNLSHRKRLPVLLLLACLLTTLCSFAQQPIPAASRGITDTGIIMAQVRRGGQLTERLPQEAFQYLTVAMENSQSAGFEKGMALASAKLGTWYFGNDVGKSIELASDALRKYDITRWGTIDDVARVHLLLAQAYDEQGKTDSSAYYYYLLGAEMEEGNITEPQFAIDVFTKLAIFWINLDYGSYNSAEYKKTILRFVDKVRDAASRIEDSADANSTIYFIQGAYYHGIKMFDSARHYYQTYLHEREKLDKLTLSRRVSTLANIADTYLQEENPGKAFEYITSIRQLGDQPQNKKFMAFYLSFTDLLAAKARYQQKRYHDVVDILDKAWTELTLTGTHLRNEVVESYEIYADANEKMGNFKRALEYKNIFIKLNDSLARKERLDMITRLEIRNRMAEKDKQLALQKLALSEANSRLRDRNFWIAGISFFALCGAIIFGLWRKKNIDKQKLQEERIGSLQQKIKIERLKASIAGEERERTRIGRELHDGIGGLLSVARMNFELAKKVKGMEENEDFTDGLRLLEEATVELRKAAYNLMPEVLLKQGLASAVQAFCEKMMSKSDTTITLQAIGDSNRATTIYDLSIYRIIQELVHNIVKHAKARHALVQLNYHEDGSLSITIEDDGIGLPEGAFEKSYSMGLRNVKERINDLGGKLDIQSSSESGTSFYLEFESYHENDNNN